MLLNHMRNIAYLASPESNQWALDRSRTLTIETVQRFSRGHAEQNLAAAVEPTPDVAAHLRALPPT